MPNELILLSEDICAESTVQPNDEQIESEACVAKIAQQPVLAVIRVAEEFYDLRKKRVVVGRQSGHYGSDISLGHNNFISRGHLELQFNSSENCWTARCNGKNGIFIDQNLLKKAPGFARIPDKCVFRFPSTEITLEFTFNADDVTNGSSIEHVNHSNCQSIDQHDQLLVITTTTTVTTVTPNQLSDTTSNCLNEPDSSNNNSQDGMISNEDIFFNSLPSPSGTMSAANSCPASPKISSLNGRFSFEHSRPIATKSVSSVSSNLLDNESLSDTESVSHELNDVKKPPFSYAQLILQAIANASDRQLTLSGIYQHISNVYPYYKETDKGWQNSIRHNLSLNRYFVKEKRNNDDHSGKGSFWRIIPEQESKLISDAFKQRRQRPVTSSSSSTSSTYTIRSSTTTSVQSAPSSPGDGHHHHQHHHDDGVVSPQPLVSSSSRMTSRTSSPVILSAGCSTSPPPLGTSSPCRESVLVLPGRSSNNNGNNTVQNTSDTLSDVEITTTTDNNSVKHSSLFNSSSNSLYNLASSSPHSSPVHAQATSAFSKVKSSSESAILNSTKSTKSDNLNKIILNQSPSTVVGQQDHRRHIVESELILRAAVDKLQQEARSKKLERKRVFTFSPLTGVTTNGLASTNLLSQSAPCSPRSVNSWIENVEILEPDRVHDSIGGTFNVRRDQQDGRQRLQLCHSPPAFVSVDSHETSGLKAICDNRARQMNNSGLNNNNRHNNGHTTTNNKTLDHNRQLYYGSGSKSLSNTPVKELMATTTTRTQQQQQQQPNFSMPIPPPQPKVILLSTMQQRMMSSNSNGDVTTGYPPIKIMKLS